MKKRLDELNSLSGNMTTTTAVRPGVYSERFLQMMRKIFE
jgi:hypothetical protein